MDRDTTLRTLAAIVLSMAVIFGWRYLFPPQPAARPPETAPVAAEATLEEPAPSAGATLDTPAVGPTVEEGGAGPVDERRSPLGAIEGPAGADPIEIVTAALDLAFSPRGARLLSLKLTQFERLPGDVEAGVVDLVSPESRSLDHHPLLIDLPDEDLQRQIDEAWFRCERSAPEPERLDELGLPEETDQVSCAWSDGAGLEVHKRLLVPLDDSCLFWVDWSIERMGRPLAGARLSWGPGISRPVADSHSNRYAYRGQAVVASNGKVKRYMPQKLGSDLVWEDGLFPRWLALDSQYFAIAFLPATGGPAAVRSIAITPADGGKPAPELTLEVGQSPVAIFAGPKSDRLLRQVDASLGSDLRDLVDWGYFGFLARPLYAALAMLEGVIGNWGWAIVILTFVIKLLFYPLTQRTMVNMRRTQEKMSKLQPKMRKIKEKYRDKKDMESRRKMQEDMMGLYKAEGVNPMAPLAGCLPLLLQLPVLYGMYTVLTVTLELRGAAFFGWIRDLSAADPLFITPIVMGVTMLGQQLLSLTKVEDPQQKAQQRMMLIMPVMFTYFFIWLPSGLVLYWLTNNVLGIGQQVLINRQAAAAVADEATTTSRGRGKRKDGDAAGVS